MIFETVDAGGFPYDGHIEWEEKTNKQKHDSLSYKGGQRQRDLKKGGVGAQQLPVWLSQIHKAKFWSAGD